MIRPRNWPSRWLRSLVTVARLTVNENEPAAVWVTAFEAVAGLVIEGVFIALLTQRFFGK